ncbi:transposase [Puia dinghuensis]|uniref:Transposase n=1 Tax=Puia dinghuensis TaxID=1792502 RepID=A0A8J2UBS4_9BACT|nr:transposase [Puia dinghuensis]GGA95373.1 transposase [Puia dinghuensis]
MLKAYKYRLYPTKEQAAQIDRSIGVCRLVFNLALEVKTWAHRNGTTLSAFDLCYQLVDLRDTFEWIREVNSQALQAAVKKVDVAFKNFFHGGGFPRFKRKRNGGSFQCPANTRKIDWEKATLTIPKIKDIPIVLSRRFEGKIKTVTISKTATGKYFAAVLVELLQEEIMPAKTEQAIGIDLGLAHFAVLSNGEKIDNPRSLTKMLARIKVLQRRASRKKKGSQNSRKANRRVAVLHEKIANQRNDFLHKVSTRLIGDNQTDTICVESLRVRNMVKNHRLSRAIVDVGWSKFIAMLEYKGRWYGKKVIRIDQWFPSSKTCSYCGHILTELDLSVREWTCASCQATHDRDVNAARNILAKGIESGVGSPAEPVEPRRMRRTRKQESIPQG